MELWRDEGRVKVRGGGFIRIYYKFATSHVYGGYGPRRRIARPLIQMMSKEGAPLGCYPLGNRAVI